MKNKFSLLIATIVAFTVLCTIPVRADVGTIDFGITNSIAAVSTNTTAPTIGSAVNIDNVDNVGLVFTGAASTASSTNVVITFARSADNSNWETTPQFTWTVPCTGLVTNVAYTNIPSSMVGSAGYLKVVSIANTGATAIMTNASLIAVKKKLR